MERRKFTIGLGALVTGSAAAMGTGAFSSAQAERTVSVSVEGDSDAFVGMTVLDEDRASEENGQIGLDFETGEGENEYGLNKNATTQFKNVFRLSNNGTNNVLIAVATNTERVYDDRFGGAPAEGNSFAPPYSLIGDNDDIDVFAVPPTDGPALTAGNSGFGVIGLDSANRVSIDNDVDNLDDDDTGANTKFLAPGQSVDVSFNIETGNNPSIEEGTENILILAATPGLEQR